MGVLSLEKGTVPSKEWRSPERSQPDGKDLGGEQVLGTGVDAGGSGTCQPLDQHLSANISATLNRLISARLAA